MSRHWERLLLPWRQELIGCLGQTSQKQTDWNRIVYVTIRQCNKSKIIIITHKVLYRYRASLSQQVKYPFLIKYAIIIVVCSLLTKRTIYHCWNTFGGGWTDLSKPENIHYINTWEHQLIIRWRQHSFCPTCGIYLHSFLISNHHY